MKKSVFVFLLAISLVTLFSVMSCNPAGKDRIQVSSPDGNIIVTFDNSSSQMQYSISYCGKEIISASKMGFEIKDHASLDSGIQVTGHKIRSYDQVWEQPLGEQRLVRENYNELLVDLAEKGGEKRKLQIAFRVFDDGVGFRYIFPEQENLGYFEIMDEKTEYNFTTDNKAWWIKAYQPNRYEYLYQTSSVSGIDSMAHTPLTMVTPDSIYLSIHEADLTDFAAMCLQPVGNGGLKCDLTPWSDGIRVKTQAPCQTPWRTIQIAQKPGDMVTSRLILNLNPPNKLGDVSWIKPVKYVGIWWGMHIGIWSFVEGENHGATIARAKQYINFAAEHSFDEVLVEGWNKGWKVEYWLDDGSDISFVEPTDDYDLIEVQNYARSKGVNVQIYHETMSNTVNYLSHIDTAFQLAASLGIKSAKIGQVGSRLDKKEFHYSQYGVNYYRKVLQKAAEYKISVNFHEPVKATGERRTYPNMFAREGARGMEYNAWDGANGGNPPSHTCILPFTRLLAGPMDYTPGMFVMAIPDRPWTNVNTTLAKQLALYVVIYSPIQMAADLIEHYEGHPAFQFIEDVPVDWDTTEVLNGSIGEYITIVRKDRNSEDWYLGSITNENAREFTITLDFLDAGKTYTAQIYKDSDASDYQANPTDYEIEEIPVKKGDAFSIKLARGGGLAVRFKDED